MTTKLPKTLPRPKADEGSDAYIRRLLKRRRFIDDQIVAAVHRYFDGARRTRKDVAWNCWKLKREEGVEVPPRA